MILEALYAVVCMSATASQDSADGPTSKHLEPLKVLIGTWTGQGKLDGGEAYTELGRTRALAGPARVTPLGNRLAYAL